MNESLVQYSRHDGSVEFELRRLRSKVLLRVLDAGVLAYSFVRLKHKTRSAEGAERDTSHR
jgi:hypothetical protein